jgi:hypothetical protein
MGDEKLKQTLVLSVDESTYYALWFEPQDRRRKGTPRISPPLEVGVRPDVVRYGSVIWAKPIFFQRNSRAHKLYPAVASGNEKFLRSTESAALGANSYLFSGEIVASDRYELKPTYDSGEQRAYNEGSMSLVVDCGVPLVFHESDLGRKDVTDGEYLEGIVRLEVSVFAGIGLYQSVAGTVRGMRVLPLDPASPSFGNVIDVGFGTRLDADPDCLHQTSSAFMVLDINEVGPLTYAPFPARAEDCPEPGYPGMVRLAESPIKTIRLGTKD